MTLTPADRDVLEQELEALALTKSHVTLPISKVLALIEGWALAEDDARTAQREVEALNEELDGADLGGGL